MLLRNEDNTKQKYHNVGPIPIYEKHNIQTGESIQKIIKAKDHPLPFDFIPTK